MANIQNAVRQGIYNRLVGASNAFRSAIAQVVSSTTYYKLFYGEAPQYIVNETLVTLPYVVLSILPIMPDRDSATKWYSCTVQFNVAAASVSECETLVGLLTDRMEDCEAYLTVSGYSVIRIDRAPQADLGPVDGVWNISVQYSLVFQ
jgi:hypothetical protein